MALGRLAAQKNLLRDLVQSMYNEGLINDDFYRVQAMKDTVRRDHVVRAVTSYCLSVEILFTRMTNIISGHNTQLAVDYLQLEVATYELFKKANSIGAQSVKVACADLVHGCMLNNFDCCFNALYSAKSETTKLRRKFEALVQIERRIIELESRF